MSEINIKKISSNRVHFYDIEGTLNLENRKLELNTSVEGLNEIFGINIYKVFIGEELYKKTNIIYILSDEEIYYSCIGCVFGYRAENSTIKLHSGPVDLILKNILSDSIDFNVRKVMFKTHYIGHSIHAAYTKRYEFKYNSNFKVIIDKNTSDNFYVTLSVESKKLSEYHKMSKVLYHIIEMIKLIFGDIPEITNIIVENEEKEIELYYGLTDKYKATGKRSNGDQILGCITEDTINKDTLKEFENFRKKTGIIYDLYMINMKSDGYKEIQNCNFIQIMEGLYKTIHKTDPDLRDIILSFFSSKNSKKILSRRDKRTVKNQNNTEIFIYKAVNHRNYLSHLNMNEIKNTFYKEENIYAYWKITLALRIFILEYLNITFEYNMVTKNIAFIEKWAKDNKLRFSSKLNKKK